MDSVANIILYFVVAICIAVFSVMTVTSRKILRAATYLLFVLIGTAVFYFQLGCLSRIVALSGSVCLSADLCCCSSLCSICL